VKLQLRLRDNISAAADMVNTIEVMRKQREDVSGAYRGDPGKAALLKQIADMDKKLFDVESKLLEPAQMTSDDKYFQQADRVDMNLIWLNGEVARARGMSPAAPTSRPPTRRSDWWKRSKRISTRRRPSTRCCSNATCRRSTGRSARR
jgi:hypothetical protein